MRCAIKKQPCYNGRAAYLHFISYYLFLFNITKAPITPGTQAQQVRMNTIRIDPQPRSYTANGGKMIDKITLQIDIALLF